jgi:hypothetical protein
LASIHPTRRQCPSRGYHPSIERRVQRHVMNIRRVVAHDFHPVLQPKHRLEAFVPANYLCGVDEIVDRRVVQRIVLHMPYAHYLRFKRAMEEADRRLLRGDYLAVRHRLGCMCYMQNPSAYRDSIAAKNAPSSTNTERLHIQPILPYTPRWLQRILGVMNCQLKRLPPKTRSS